MTRLRRRQTLDRRELGWPELCLLRTGRLANVHDSPLVFRDADGVLTVDERAAEAAWREAFAEVEDGIPASYASWARRRFAGDTRPQWRGTYGHLAGGVAARPRIRELHTDPSEVATGAETMTPIDRRHVSIHEAGHAIVGDVLGLTTPDVVISRSDRGLVSQNWDRLALDDRGLSDLATMDLAGAAASAAFGLPEPDRGAEHDVRQATAIARFLDPARADVLLDDLRETAGDLCRRHRDAIARFAATLDLAGRLAGDEVRIALDAARDGGPTPRFDAASRFEFMRARRRLFESMSDEFPKSPAQLAELWSEAGWRALNPDAPWMPAGWRLPPAVPAAIPAKGER